MNRLAKIFLAALLGAALLQGAAFEKGELTLADLSKIAHEVGEPAQISGKQEYFEMIINQYI